MASEIFELFGFAASDQSNAALTHRRHHSCPFLKAPCQKKLSDGILSGVCTLKPKTSRPVICCPYRLYAGNYRILSDIATLVFKGDIELVAGQDAKKKPVTPGKTRVAVFGKRWGKELRLPNRGDGTGGYFVDWVLARLDETGKLVEFVAVEVQSIDTTGNYRAERQARMDGNIAPVSTAGFNWENVSKRILPQIIYKGHVLRRERLCRHGLFFVCPEPVYNKVRERLGGTLYSYPLQPGSLTLMWYDVGSGVHGEPLQLDLKGSFTTTVDQVANAFTSPSNLPDENVYEAAINAEL